MGKEARRYPFWQVAPQIVILGAGASVAAFPAGDKNGRTLPLMNDFTQILNLGPLFEKYEIEYVGRNFEEIYDEIHSALGKKRLVQAVNRVVEEYFSEFQITDDVTIYDEIILSLRKKDLIFSFNWDPLLMQAYSRNLFLDELPEVHFLHGNVAMGACIEHKRAGYFGNSCSVCEKPYIRSKLLYPIKDKNYKFDPFIKGEWTALEHNLDLAFILTVFGYSAPTTDVAAKEIMKKAWAQNDRKRLNEVEMVDVKTEDELHKIWQDFIVKQHFITSTSIRNTLSFMYLRRSCDAWGSAIMMNEPWSEKRLPQYTDLEDLQRFVLPLIEEERRSREIDEPLAKF